MHHRDRPELPCPLPSSAHVARLAARAWTPADAAHDREERARRSDPLGLLESAEARFLDRLRRPMTGDGARALCLILRPEARGRVPFPELVFRAGVVAVLLQLHVEAGTVGKGTESARRRALARALELLTYLAIPGACAPSEEDRARFGF